jgi:Raf kinase inhibitor-like YbhB/YbcL family protein
MKALTITSPAFENNKLIPSKYTCDGTDVNPPLTMANIPETTKTLALIVEDPDVPAGLWIHWIAWNIPPIPLIQEDSVPEIEGLNTNRRLAYHGPCPPSGTHRYFFRVYALDAKLDLGENSDKKDVERAMQGHILAKGELMGLYKRSR